MGSKVNLGSIRVTGVKWSFYQICPNSSILNSLPIRLMNIYTYISLTPSTYVKGQPGLFGVTGVKS